MGWLFSSNTRRQSDCASDHPASTNSVSIIWALEALWAVLGEARQNSPPRALFGHWRGPDCSSRAYLRAGLQDHIDFTAQQENESRQVEPGHEHDDAANRAVRDVVAAEVGRVFAQAPAGEETRESPEQRAWRQELEPPLPVGKQVVSERGAERDRTRDDRPAEPSPKQDVTRPHAHVTCHTVARAAASRHPDTRTQDPRRQTR